MSNEQDLNDRKYDLEERTAKFGEEVIRFCRDIPRSELTRRIIDQLVGCGTSVGAQYCEADDAESPKDFKHKIGLCKKESREAKHFFRMAGVAIPEMADRAKILWQEAKELNLIFIGLTHLLSFRGQVHPQPEESLIFAKLRDPSTPPRMHSESVGMTQLGLVRKSYFNKIYQKVSNKGNGD